METDFLNHVPVEIGGRQQHVCDVLEHQPALAAQLHEQDRVHTYGSFYIADLRV